MNDPQENPNRPSWGPFVTAILSTALATGLMIAIKAGWQLTLVSALGVFVPGMTFTALLIALSMGWIFVAIGRYQTQPRWVWGCGIVITITMVELMVLTFMADGAGKIQ